MNHTSASANGTDRRRIPIGLALLAVVAIVIYMVTLGPDGCSPWDKIRGNCPKTIETATVTPTASAGPTEGVINLKGLACGSKADLLKNPEIKHILLERYRIGDIDCPATPSGDCANAERLKDRDFIWPAGLYYVEMCRNTLRKSLDYDVIYMTPIVFYSWDCVTDELVQRGQVTQKDGVYYIPDMQSFARTIVVDKLRWERACGVNGRVVVLPTDPVKSASGLEFVALLAGMLNGREVVNESSIGPLLPVLKQYIDDLGYLEETSAKLFAVCTRRGMGGCPLFTVYESQGIDQFKKTPNWRTTDLSRFRILYPQPTMLADHELIALTANGKRFLDAMKDTEIQEIQWRDHGFRTGLGRNDPKELGDIDGIPESIDSVINSPSGPVLDRIKCYLKPDASGCPGAATPPAKK